MLFFLSRFLASSVHLLLQLAGEQLKVHLICLRWRLIILLFLALLGGLDVGHEDVLLWAEGVIAPQLSPK